jgi:hypothetical protein
MKDLGRDVKELVARSIEDFVGQPGECELFIITKVCNTNRYHCRDKVQSSHSNTDILIVDTGQNCILVLRNEMRVGRNYFDHREKCNILH